MLRYLCYNKLAALANYMADNEPEHFKQQKNKTKLSKAYRGIEAVRGGELMLEKDLSQQLIRVKQDISIVSRDINATENTIDELRYREAICLEDLQEVRQEIEHLSSHSTLEDVVVKALVKEASCVFDLNSIQKALNEQQEQVRKLQEQLSALENQKTSLEQDLAQVSERVETLNSLQQRYQSIATGRRDTSWPADRIRAALQRSSAPVEPVEIDTRSKFLQERLELLDKSKSIHDSRNRHGSGEVGLDL
jgi:chromosome segregation ATPase